MKMDMAHVASRSVAALTFRPRSELPQTETQLMVPQQPARPHGPMRMEGHAGELLVFRLITPIRPNVRGPVAEEFPDHVCHLMMFRLEFHSKASGRP